MRHEFLRGGSNVKLFESFCGFERAVTPTPKKTPKEPSPLRHASDAVIRLPFVVACELQRSPIMKSVVTTPFAMPRLLLVSLLLAVAASLRAATYTADNTTVLSNPERGYHNRYEIINDPAVNDYASAATSIAGFNPDALDRTFARAKAAGNTLIHSYVHLDKYTDVDQLPQPLLDNLASGLAAIRTAGLKIVLRPAYSWANSTSVPEARTLGHIAQLNAVISANADVVEHLEAGWLGAWGEWHDSQFTDAFNRAQADTRYRVVKKILDTTPASIPVAIRYPIFVKEVLELPVPSGTTALTTTDRDRLGFHNDCFLSDSADMGTYDQNSWMGWFYVEDKRQWVIDYITSYGGNKVIGGETCDSAGNDDAAGVQVQQQMSSQHWTEINEDFAAVNVNIWKAANLAATGNDPAETAYTRIKRKLGYRFRLATATFPTSANPGGSFAFAADLANDGYASPLKPRSLYLVFDNGTNRYNVAVPNTEVRAWKSGAISVSQTVTLPNMVSGTYKLALWLPDPATALQSRPEYSIRLANTGIWDATKGYNVLANSITIGAPTAPGVPTNLAATAGNTQAALTWTAVANADSYTLLRSTTNGSGYAQVAASLTGTSYTNTGLTNNTTYYYVLRAVNTVGTSANSNQASVTPNNTVALPSAPASFTATAGNAQVALSWSASSGATSYTVLRSTTSGSGYAQVSAGITGTTYTDTGLTNGTAYYYVVRAVNSAGASGNSTQASGTPNAPSPLTLDSFPTQTQLTNHVNDIGQAVSWSMDSLYYGSDTAGNLIMNSGQTGQYLQEGIGRSLAGATTLTLRLRDWSDTDTEAHWNVVLNDGSDHVVGPIGTYGNVTGSYTAINIPMSAFGANLANAQSLKIVHRDATYSVLMIDSIAFDGGGSGGGGGGGDTQAPTTPTGLTSPSKTANTVSLSWTASTDNVAVTAYDVKRNGVTVGSPTTTSFTDTGLAASTAYTYTVVARDAAGNASAASSSLAVTTNAATDTQAPTAPTGLTSPSKTATTVNLSWTASTDNVGVTSYEIRRGGNAVGTATSTSFVDSGLTPNTAYSYTVVARDAAGNTSAASSALAVTTSGSSDTQAPTAPTGLTSPSKTATTVSLSWTASTDNVGVTAYDIKRAGATVGTAAMTSFTDTGLTASTAYSYTVVARDAAGNVSAASSPLSVTTSAASSGSASYEAESSGNTLAGGAVVSSSANASGGAKVGYVGNGGTLTFNGVTAASAGNYVLTLVYLSAEARSVQVTVNAGSPVTVALPSSGGWDVLKTYDLTVALASGNNTVKLANPSGWAPDIDRIVVSTSGGVDLQAPTVPTNVVFGTITTSSIALSWTAATDNIGVTGYTVRRNGAIVGTPTATSYSDTGLASGTTYNYTVAARDAAGNFSDQTATASATTLTAPDTTAPSAPTGLNGSAGSSNVFLTWTAATDNVAVTGYIVFRGGTQIGTSTATSYQDIGLNPATAYSYTVKARDAAGNISAASSAFAITTQSASSGGGFTTVPGGVAPVNPFPVGTPSGSLTAHALTRAADPLTNPLKGGQHWYYSGTPAQRPGIPTSMRWRYFGLGEIMTGPNTYDWSIVETVLNENAWGGQQLTLRVASANSGHKDTPDFLSSYIAVGSILKYNDPYVMQQLLNFIAALGARYDGDPRISYIEMGLIGDWGEWHTWMEDGGTNQYMPTDANANAIINAYDNAFVITPVLNRYARSGGLGLTGAARKTSNLTSLSTIGYHDDSFAHREADPELANQVLSMTMPQSLGGKTDGFVQVSLNYGAENKWITAPHGGEFRPEEVGADVFHQAASSHDKAIDALEVSHTSFLTSDQGPYNPNDPDEVAFWSKMGYILHVDTAYFNNTVTGTFNVGVRVQNTGVAPFPGNPSLWRTELGLKDSSGNVVKTWGTGWDLRTVLPLQIRALPDWGLPGNPTYTTLGSPTYFQASVSATGVTAGSYHLVMRIRNPLLNYTQATLLPYVQNNWLPYLTPWPVSFANTTQNADGWLDLGTITVN